MLHQLLKLILFLKSGRYAAQDRTSHQMVRYLHNEIENNEDIEVIKEARRQINEVYNPMIKLEESVADTVLGKVFCAGCMVAMGYLGYKFVSFIAEENARYYKWELGWKQAEIDALIKENSALKQKQCWWNRTAE